MKNYGEAFRYFRKLNGYSLEYAAADSISKSQPLDLKGEKMKFLSQRFLNYYQISMFR